jgi:hypothetical protein
VLNQPRQTAPPTPRGGHGCLIAVRSPAPARREGTIAQAVGMQFDLVAPARHVATLSIFYLRMGGKPAQIYQTRCSPRWSPRLLRDPARFVEELTIIDGQSCGEANLIPSSARTTYVVGHALPPLFQRLFRRKCLAARGHRPTLLRARRKVEDGMVGFVNVKTDYRACATTVRFSSRET